MKQLAKDGDQLAIDVLCNLAAPYEGTALGRHADVSKRASDLLADVYSNETAQPAVRSAVDFVATWAGSNSTGTVLILRRFLTMLSF